MWCWCNWTCAHFLKVYNKNSLLYCISHNNMPAYLPVSYFLLNKGLMSKVNLTLIVDLFQWKNIVVHKTAKTHFALIGNTVNTWFLFAQGAE